MCDGALKRPAIRMPREPRWPLSRSGVAVVTGRSYPKLSTIAQAITGTSWNGPRFFGLRGASGPEAAAEPVPVVKGWSRASSRSSIGSSGRASQGMEGRP